MANQDSKNFVESVMDAQKQAVETVVENTKKLTNGNAMVNDTIAKGSEWYKNWLDTRKMFFQLQLIKQIRLLLTHKTIWLK